MINNINSSGKYITIYNNTSAPYIDMSMPSAGILRFNGSTMEVYNGSVWVPLNNNPSITLTTEAETLLDWAKEKIRQQEKREELIQNNPALKIAYERIKKAEADFDILEKFVENDPI